MQSYAKAGVRFVAIICLAGHFSSQALAQATETEPNDTCQTAQIVGAVDGNTSFTVSGSLDTPPEEPDVDFFRFEATPGAQLGADHKGQASSAGTLFDPLLGLFDSDCNLLRSDEDGGVGFDSRLRFDVPADGIFVLAASSNPDFTFTGDGSSSGTYELMLSPPPPEIGSISGRIVDALTGQPLPGNEPPFAFAELLRCEEDECLESVSSQNSDAEGRFRFELDFEGQPLPVGTYQVRASAIDSEQRETDPFEVGEGEDVDVGDIPLPPPPISFSDIQPCQNLLPQGDTCRYSVRVRNNTASPIEGLAWSPVDGRGVAGLGYTLFEASTRRGARQAVRERISLQPSAEETLEFQFDVPAVVTRATFCTRAFIGLNPSPLVMPVREVSLFCITPGDTGFQVMSQGESQKIFQELSGQPEELRKQPAR